ncbi:MAG: bacterial proteasome activator family protein [Acidimicrobiia bacterium]|nr:bacterial proteasome activator family protein [Acidimicrobiia bacterium]
MTDETPSVTPNTNGDRQPPGGDPLTPEVVEALGDGAEGGGEQVSSPAKLIRIATMVRSLLEEARRAPLDDAGRRLLREIHERSRRELEEILSEDLRSELTDVSLPFTIETPTESELLIAQAQLVGWLEGLFHGIQATLFTQQVAAQHQFEEMRRHRALGTGLGRDSQPGDERDPGAYL